MPSQQTLSAPGALDRLVARLSTITPDTKRQWGRMTPHQMLCHLSDAFLVVNGERSVAKPVDNFINRTLVKFIALHTAMPWPKGAKTSEECDADKKGTPPAIFADDRAKTVRLLQEFAAPSAVPARHPLFGPMSREDWMIWAWRHVDHHLRQFGA